MAPFRFIRQKSPSSNEQMVGAVRFELTTSCTRNKRATRLRYAPNQTRAGKWGNTVTVAMDFSGKVKTPARHLCFGRGMRESEVPEPSRLQVRDLKTATPRSKA